jgi:hypothetical protein
MFDGDTIAGFARFADVAGQQKAVLEAVFETGEVVREEVASQSTSSGESGEDVSIVARLAAQARSARMRSRRRLRDSAPLSVTQFVDKLDRNRGTPGTEE